MSEPTQFLFPHKEIVQVLLEKQGIHEGIWGLLVKFGLKVSNVGSSPSDILPAAIIPVLEIGLQRVKEENNLAVDAAKVNPKSPRTRPGVRRAR